MSFQRSHHLLMTVIALAALALVWLNLTYYPLGNGRDEIDHLTLMEFYANHNRLPTLPEDLTIASEQAHQPPLYHLLMAGVLKILPQPDALDYQENPFLLRDNYNPDLPPYNRVLIVQQADSGTATFHLLRIITALMNGIGVWFVWKTIRTLFPPADSHRIAPLALAFLILTPTFWRTGISLNNNHLLFLWASLAVYIMARQLMHGITWKNSLLLGAVMGLGLLTKLYMLPLFGAAAFVYAQAAAGKRRSQTARFGGGALVAAGVVASGWYLRNWQLYDDPTASTITETLLDSRRTDPLTLTDWGEALTSWIGELWIESWNVLNTTPSLIFASALGITLLILAVLATRNLSKSYGWRVMGFLWSVFLPALAMAMVGAARNTHADYSPPLLLSGLPALVILLTLGILAWVPRRWQWRTTLSGVLLILALTVIFHARFFTPLFPPISHHAAQSVDIEFANGIRLVGYELDDTSAPPDTWTRIKLCWQTDRPQTQNVAFSLQLVLPDLPRAALQDGYHFSGRHPSSLWTPGETLCEWVPLDIHAEAVTPRAYQVIVSLYGDAGENIPWLDDPTRPPVLDRITIATPQADLPTVDWQVDDWARLSVDATFSEATATLTLNWQTLAATASPYHVFVHVLDANGDLIPGAQLDQPPLQNAYPTTHWIANTTYSETLQIALPPEAVSIKLGVYDVASGRRGIWQDGSDGLQIPLQP